MILTLTFSRRLYVNHAGLTCTWSWRNIFTRALWRQCLNEFWIDSHPTEINLIITVFDWCFSFLILNYAFIPWWTFNWTHFLIKKSSTKLTWQYIKNEEKKDKCHRCNQRKNNTIANGKRTSNNLQNTTQKTKVQAKLSKETKNECRCSWRISSSCSTSYTRRVPRIFITSIIGISSFLYSKFFI